LYSALKSANRFRGAWSWD